MASRQLLRMIPIYRNDAASVSALLYIPLDVLPCCYSIAGTSPPCLDLLFCGQAAQKWHP
jgi:hypothetical protein